MCSSIEYQLKPKEIEKCIRRVDGFRRGGDLCAAHLCPDNVDALRKLAKRRGKVNVKTYTVRQRRWKNEDYFCNFCKRWVSVNEVDHYESWCSGIPGTPTSSSSTVYIASRCKRFRHLTKLVD